MHLSVRVVCVGVYMWRVCVCVWYVRCGRRSVWRGYMCLYMVGRWRLTENKWDSREGCAFQLAFRGWIPFSAASHFLPFVPQPPSELPRPLSGSPPPSSLPEVRRAGLMEAPASPAAPEDMALVTGGLRGGCEVLPACLGPGV